MFQPQKVEEWAERDFCSGAGPGFETELTACIGDPQWEYFAEPGIKEKPVMTEAVVSGW